jgi:hypothetical protein
VKLAGTDNFATLKSLDWQVHVYGQAKAQLRAMCSRRDLLLHVFPWQDSVRRTGLRQNAAYLVRPDGYIAVVEPEGIGERIDAYLERHHVHSLALSGSRSPVSSV